MGQSVVGDQRGYVGKFRGLGAKKFTACWSIEEQVGNRDGSSARKGCVFDAMNFATCYFDASTGSIISIGSFQMDAGDRGNGWQRFTAEAECCDREQFVRGTQFGSSVALKGQKRIISIHSVAVVGDANELSATRFDLKADSGR